ncbi:MAG: PorP/SprF family type IX secretion system membrane protein [Bacteroidota bacterium]
MKKILVLFIALFSFGKASAQDGHLSMYDASPLFLNAGLTGVFEGKWRLHANYRTQWKSVNFKPYQSALISFDMPVGKWGFGVQLNNFRAGYGNFNVLQGLLSAAYTVPLSKKRTHMLSFGVQAGATQKSLEYQLLSFNNQYTITDGGGFDQTVTSGENFGAQSRILPSTNASIIYYFAKQQSRLNPFVGFSAFNLIEPKESFYDQDNRLPRRFYAHIGTRINITEQFYLLPKVLFMQQRKFSEQTYALEAGYFLKGSELYLLGGLIYRSNDAMIATIGAKMENITLRLGYDINVSSLSTSSTGRGGFEVALTYVHGKNKPKVEKICPRL